MDEFLNELYGTSEIIGGDDLEKQAAAEFLVKLAEQEGVNLDDLSDEEVGSLLSEIEGEMGKQASAETETGTDEAQEKLAEADFLGRAMAHAYVNELHEIEKEAASLKGGYEAVKGALGKALGKGKEYAARAGEATGVSQMGRGLKATGKSALRKAEITKDLKSKGRFIPGKTKVKVYHKGQEELAPGAKRFAKRVLGPAAALETARRVGKAQGEKEVQSFDERFEAAARERAYEMLAEAGYDVEKVAQADIDTVALQMLESAGYPVNWE